MGGPAETMPAAVYKGRRTVVVEEVPVPRIGDDQVLLQVSHCGVCGTDLHLMMEDWGLPGSVAGHEYSGEVAAVGAAVEGWGVGDRAVGGPGRGCGTCGPCRAGRTNLCVTRQLWNPDVSVTGAFAPFKAVDAASLFRVPEGLDLRTAALTEPLAVALHGVHRSAVPAGSRALVTGAGPIGLLTVAVLRAVGVADVTVSEPGARRRELATKVGAAVVGAPGDLPVPEMPMELVPAPFDVAFECSGRSDAMEAALANLGRAGTLVLSGSGMHRPRFDPNRIILNELVVTGTAEYTPADYEEALELLASARLPTADLIEPDDVPLSGMLAAMEQLVAGERAGKVMVVPRA
ncbi:MAG TPA: alcohol dehydrogenase catalytic domain-containing protein [Acidimicrobiales bacterium]|nr:alcohol dehydrogenase catalytic domain-containing protein [Acidimicrobiales bacterium]